MTGFYRFDATARRASGRWRRTRTPAVVALATLATLAALAPACRDRSPATTSERSVLPIVSIGSSIPLPGTPPFNTALSQRLKGAWEGRKSDYVPRTRHLMADGSPAYINRLFLESSPYLLQHAHNPVDWRPWGDEAFAEARARGRAGLLSIGYATCHWCHVMEEESFEDEEIARALNENYICIKIDREERPDVDAVYMTAVQALTGSGGWPMTVWLTPDREPFAGGTYFPPRDGDRGARVGLLSLLRERKRMYREQPARVMAAAADLAQKVREGLQASDRGAPSTDVSWRAPTQPLTSAAREYARRFDAVNGGLVGAPKFPSSLPVRFELRYYRRTGDVDALRMAVTTLERMAAGGIHDQVGGGFHRYSTDARWLVPHFEKMLYDNALLTVAYVEAFQVTGRQDFATIAREVLRYVERDMTSPEGAFYSATDADSLSPEGHLEEGRFFTWTPAEIEGAVGSEVAPLVVAYYGVTAPGDLDGRSVLSTPRGLEDVARDFHLAPERARAALDGAVEVLYTARSRRRAPQRDEKVLASWNGLMIGAYARASLALGNDRYGRIAARAADFVLTQMRDGPRLAHSLKDGRRGSLGYLDDYAFTIAGLLDLYEATSDPHWLKEAAILDAVLRDDFEDKGGGYLLTPSGAEALLAREKPAYDGAEPCGNSVATLDLLRLSELTTRDQYRARAERALRAFADGLERAPTALSEMLLALDFATDRAKEIVLVAPSSPAETGPLLARVRATYLPNRVLTRVVAGAEAQTRTDLEPIVAGKIAIGGRATGYVCEARACKLPTTDPEVFARQLRDVFPLPK
jgi:uncharacterized protein YyaL (SSP411 family)